MKRALIVLMVLMLGTGGLFAQEAGTFTLGTRLGFAFGFNNDADLMRMPYYMGLVNEEYLDLVPFDRSMRMNFTTSIFAAYTLIDNLSLQFEFNIMANQGFNGDISEDGFTLANLQLSYTSLDIPVLVRYSFLDGMLGILAGPHISIPLGRALLWMESPLLPELGGLGIAAEIDNFATFGLTAGVVAGIPAGPGRFVGDLRFLFDFNSIGVNIPGFDDDGDITTRTIDVMTRRALVFTLGYQLSF